MTDEKKPKRNRKWVLWVVVAVVGLPLLCGLILNWAEEPATADIREPTQAVDNESDDSPTRAPRPTATFYPSGVLRVAINDALGESNRDRTNDRKFTTLDYREGEGSISVTWAADDNFSSGLIVAGIKNDAAAVLRAIDESGVDYERVFLAATFAVQDAAGHASESEVMLASYDRATIERIDWSSFLATEVFDIAINYNIAPVLSE